jgi:hypothetical protein
MDAEGTVRLLAINGYAILIAGEIAVHGTVFGGTSRLIGVRRRRAEHDQGLRCEGGRFRSSTSAACAAPSGRGV